MYADETEAVKRGKKMAVLIIYATKHNWRCIWLTVNNDSWKHRRTLILMSYVKINNYFGKPENTLIASQQFLYTWSGVDKRGL